MRGVMRGLYSAGWWVSAGSLGAIAGLIGADVFARTFLNYTFRGTVEIVELLALLVVFPALAYGQEAKSNVAIEFLTCRWSSRMRAGVEAIHWLVSLAFFVLLGWASFVQTGVVWSKHATTGVLYIPLWPFELVIAVGYWLLSIVLAKDAFVCLYLAFCGRVPSAEMERGRLTTSQNQNV